MQVHSVAVFTVCSLIQIAYTIAGGKEERRTRNNLDQNKNADLKVAVIDRLYCIKDLDRLQILEQMTYE